MHTNPHSNKVAIILAGAQLFRSKDVDKTKPNKSLAAYEANKLCIA